VELQVVRWLRRDTPICPTHGICMRTYKVNGSLCYYKCRECDFKAKIQVVEITKKQRY
jgi:hypothetical protein